MNWVQKIQCLGPRRCGRQQSEATGEQRPAFKGSPKPFFGAWSSFNEQGGATEEIQAGYKQGLVRSLGDSPAAR